MTKADIEGHVRCSHGNLSHKEARLLVDVVLERIKDNLHRGGKVQIKGFGQFEVRRNLPRIGRNIQTGEVVPIGERRGIVFRPSKLLKKLVQDGATRDSR